MFPSRAPTSRSIIAIDAVATARARVELADLAALHAFATRLARLLRPGDLVALEGALGAGKSELARAVIRARAGAAIEVPSPTFTLVQRYPLPDLVITHADLYRLGDPAEIDELGLDEALAEGALLVEWPERAGDRLPADRLRLVLSEPAGGPPERRTILIEAGPSWRARLGELLP
ncbi:MAG: tRNA (adenosine(37)-N6)-threonylcarbamoyltransferase complex ATPase subunit type 1 TsaE [Elioraea sp.]|nr:tRNA (adenosine(37)-N6)-threonylcarbamoyltransferase complex ATPase subunit type 1 TsaE [Elioraea sp.]MDW8370932.1 tRNA (adenosine(37)-N6)-threonylcarbamoyltransferase complex ATPase subunit type 1 TsaE [Geminicoccaceae bacterium]